MAQTNYGDYHYFYYLGSNRHYGFATYRDPSTGRVRGYVEARDKNNQPVYKYWHFNMDSLRIKRVGKNEIDLDGQKAVDFLRGAPSCYKSPNAETVGDKQVNCFYKEVDEAGDAKAVVDTRRGLIKAQNAALELKGQELIDIANYIGVFSKEDEILTQRVLDFSSNQPTKFLEMVKDPTIKVRSLIRRCVNSGVFKEDGLMISWETKTIGNDENEAVATLMKDQKLLDAVKTHLAKFGG